MLFKRWCAARWLLAHLNKPSVVHRGTARRASLGCRGRRQFSLAVIHTICFDCCSVPFSNGCDVSSSSVPGAIEEPSDIHQFATMGEENSRAGNLFSPWYVASSVHFIRPRLPSHSVVRCFCVGCLSHIPALMVSFRAPGRCRETGMKTGCRVPLAPMMVSDAPNCRTRR